MAKRNAGRRRRGSNIPARSFHTPLETPLERLLETPGLARVVPQLAPETLHQLIAQRGLDVCAEIVALTTPAQLAAVLDLDLWRRTRAGHDERFDAERFGEWLELLVDAGGSVAARIVAAMDETLVVAGLSRYVRVFDPVAMVTIVEGEPVAIEAPTHPGPECEVGGYRVRGRTTAAWDAIVALLLALDAEHPERFHAVMRACRRLSNSTPEVDGLDDLLTAPEQVVHDVALEREDRRARQGYSTSADARAFLQMARQRRRPSIGEPPVNPLVAAYFRAVNDRPSPAGVSVPDLPTIAGPAPHRPRALLEGARSQSSPLARIRSLVAYVRDNDAARHVARSQELAFLANTLVAGCSIQSRAFTLQEAADAALSVCNLGLEDWPARSLPDTLLMDSDLVSAFEAGWALLHEEVGLFAAGQLVLALADLQCSDAAIQEGLDALRIELTKQCAAGTPWLARDALEVMAMLDMPAWVGVLGLLDECPVIAAALTATLDRRIGAVSATAFEFIASRSQLGAVREFMARFPDILFR